MSPPTGGRARGHAEGEVPGCRGPGLSSARYCLQSSGCVRLPGRPSTRLQCQFPLRDVSCLASPTCPWDRGRWPLEASWVPLEPGAGLSTLVGPRFQEHLTEEAAPSRQAQACGPTGPSAGPGFWAPLGAGLRLSPVITPLETREQRYWEEKRVRMDSTWRTDVAFQVFPKGSVFCVLLARPSSNGPGPGCVWPG